LGFLLLKKSKKNDITLIKTLIVGVLSLELKRVICRRVDWGVGLLFFALVVSIFAIALGGELRQIRPVHALGVIWVAVTLSTLLSLEKLFRADFKQGVLDQYLLSPIPLSLLLFIKISVHWLATGFPLLFLTPLMALFLNIPFALLPLLLLTLAIGTQILSALGSLGALLTVGLPRAGILSSVLLLPLYLPALLLAMSTLANRAEGLPYFGSLAWLGVLWIFTQLLSPSIGAGILKVCKCSG
jgi:heme exporter protein B